MQQDDQPMIAQNQQWRQLLQRALDTPSYLQYLRFQDSFEEHLQRNQENEEIVIQNRSENTVRQPSERDQEEQGIFLSLEQRSSERFQRIQSPSFHQDDQIRNGIMEEVHAGMELQRERQEVQDEFEEEDSEEEEHGQNTDDTEKDAQRFAGKYAPMKINPIIHKWVKKRRICLESRKKFEKEYRNRPYFFMILGELQLKYKEDLESFQKDFKDLKKKQKAQIRKKYANRPLVIKYFNLELDYSQQCLKRFIMGDEIEDVVDPIFKRDRPKLRAKSRKQKAELIKMYKDQYGFDGSDSIY